ncbi:nuclear transport factor 2 family protein [Rhodocaloribacter litoris]|uniref:YybH family protein n=1 Tax=Rhodocaloribacter litoris TaxID=2558931 RepID=UPI00141DE6E8|nr:nuclear transport factor 2 family protein [Rhodocaloribacter litoris]QXD14319.1 nuclear transport factor 2 family protein [Rhodocaloribacter litoris]
MTRLRLRAPLAVLVLLLLSACAQPEPPAQEAPSPAELEALLEQQAQAIREGDLATLDALWSSGEAVYIFEQGGVDSSWAAYRDHHLGPELEALDDLDFRHEDVRIRAGQDLAVATGRYVLKARHEDRPVESQGVFTTVLAREEGGWKIVHSHLSRRCR